MEEDYDLNTWPTFENTMQSFPGAFIALAGKYWLFYDGYIHKQDITKPS